MNHVKYITMNCSCIYLAGVQDFEKGGLDRPHDGEVEVRGSLKRGVCLSLVHTLT